MAKIIQQLSQKASFISRLLLNEIPENIETVFESVSTHLLPNDYKDFKVSCDCPDYAVPCKHIAGVCYRLAEIMDNDPFLLFEMRGLAPEKLLQQLANPPLGKILSDAKSTATAELTPVNSFYTRPLLCYQSPSTHQPKELLARSTTLTQKHRTQHTCNNPRYAH